MFSLTDIFSDVGKYWNHLQEWSKCHLYLKCLHISKTLRNNHLNLEYLKNSYDLIFISVLEKEYKERKYWKNQELNPHWWRLDNWEQSSEQKRETSGIRTHAVRTVRLLGVRS